jgi:hypothetical protein
VRIRSRGGGLVGLLGRRAGLDGILEGVIEDDFMNGKSPCLTAPVFVLLSVVLLRMVSGVSLTWRHIGNIHGTAFLSMQRIVSYDYSKKAIRSIPGFPGF